MYISLENNLKADWKGIEGVSLLVCKVTQLCKLVYGLWHTPNTSFVWALIFKLHLFPTLFFSSPSLGHPLLLIVPISGAFLSFALPPHYFLISSCLLPLFHCHYVAILKWHQFPPHKQLHTAVVLSMNQVLSQHTRNSASLVDTIS